MKLSLRPSHRDEQPGQPRPGSSPSEGLQKVRKNGNWWSINAFKPLYFWGGGGVPYLFEARWSKRSCPARQRFACTVNMSCCFFFWLGTRSSQNQRIVKRQARPWQSQVRNFICWNTSLKPFSDTIRWTVKSTSQQEHSISMCCVSFVVRPSVGSTFNFFRNDVFVLPASLPFRDSLLWRSDLEKNWFLGSKEGEIETFDSNELLVG